LATHAQRLAEVLPAGDVCWLGHAKHCELDVPSFHVPAAHRVQVVGLETNMPGRQKPLTGLGIMQIVSLVEVQLLFTTVPPVQAEHRTGGVLPSGQKESRGHSSHTTSAVLLHADALKNPLGHLAQG
jgi:hypothetical protein